MWKEQGEPETMGFVGDRRASMTVELKTVTYGAGVMERRQREGLPGVVRMLSGRVSGFMPSRILDSDQPCGQDTGLISGHE